MCLSFKVITIIATKNYLSLYIIIMLIIIQLFLYFLRYDPMINVNNLQFLNDTTF